MCSSTHDTFNTSLNVCVCMLHTTQTVTVCQHEEKHSPNAKERCYTTLKQHALATIIASRHPNHTTTAQA
jgi:hypothetical protein